MKRRRTYLWLDLQSVIHSNQGKQDSSQKYMCRVAVGMAYYILHININISS